MSSVAQLHTHNTRSAPGRRLWETRGVGFGEFAREHQAGTYNLDPEHQRGIVHSKAWMRDIITSALVYNDLPPVRFHWRPMANGTRQYESLDGKQRCVAVIRYMTSELAVDFGDIELGDWDRYGRAVTYQELTPPHQQLIAYDCQLDVKTLHGTLTRAEIEEFFQRAQQTKKTLVGEHLNSCVDSTKRSALTPLVNDERFKPLLKAIKPNADRFSHLEMLARLLFAFHRSSESVTRFDPTPDALKTWWKDDDVFDEGPVPASFITSAQLALTLIQEADITNKMNKSTYLPIYWYILQHCWDWGVIGSPHLEPVQALQHMLRSGGVVLDGPGRTGNALARYHQLCQLMGFDPDDLEEGDDEEQEEISDDN
jgi:hypothetical protein